MYTHIYTYTRIYIKSSAVLYDFAANLVRPYSDGGFKRSDSLPAVEDKGNCLGKHMSLDFEMKGIVCERP